MDSFQQIIKTELNISDDEPVIINKAEGETISLQGETIKSEPIDLCVKEEHFPVFKEELFACLGCEYITENVDEFEKHKQTHAEEKYACDVCTFRTSHALVLMRHMKRHSTKVEQFKCQKCGFTCNVDENTKILIDAHFVYSCNKCSFKFCTYAELVQHYTQSHTYTCEFCNYQTNTIYILKSHHKKHENYKKMFETYYRFENTCRLCNFTSPEKMVLYAHIKAHCVNEPYSCYICEYVCLRKIDLLSHLTIVHEATQKMGCPFVCKYCNYKTATTRALGFHISRIHKNRIKITCDICGKKYFTEYQLSKHIKQAHASTLQYKYFQKCNLCSYQTPLMINLFKHKKEHYHGWFKCEVCEWKTLTLFQLKTHLSDVHKIKVATTMLLQNQSETVTFDCTAPCILCNFKGMSPSGLRFHMELVHHKPLKCALCNFRCKQISIILQHIKGAHCENSTRCVRQNRLLLKCTRCDYKGNFLSVKRHKIVHTLGYKKYKTCTLCKHMMNNDRKTYRHHMAKHKQEKMPTPCVLCCYVGINLLDVKLHEATHREGPLYICSFCPYTIMKRQSMVKHVQKNHIQQLNNREGE